MVNSSITLRHLKLHLEKISGKFSAHAVSLDLSKLAWHCKLELGATCSAIVPVAHLCGV